jgi:hypothetical protein
VSHDQQRPLLPAPLQARDDVGAIGIERENLGGDAFGVERLLEMISGSSARQST